MRRASMLLYLSLSAGAAGTAGLVPTEAAAQPKGPLPGYLALHAKTRGFSLGRPLKPVPTPDGKFVLFLRATASSPELRLYEFTVATGKTRELLTPAQLLQGVEEQLAPEEKARRERMRQSLRGFTSFEISSDGTFLLIPLSGKLYTVNRQSGL
ncbi:MAG TPA: S9 family peptidase, partial [Pseudomonadota bacterium]|nr:S9 family peptidase [Pseudomonadota bacterium]